MKGGSGQSRGLTFVTREVSLWDREFSQPSYGGERKGGRYE